MMLLILGFYSCSFGNIDRISCEESKDCNTHFGTGYICDREGKNTGYCVEATETDRCFHTTPSEAYNNLSDYILIGSLYNPSYDLPTIKAMDLVIEQANETESIGDKKLAIIHCDISDDTTGEIDGEVGETVVKNTTRYLVDELQITAIIGPSTSTNSSWAYDIAKTSSILISPSATSIGLSVIDGEVKTEENPGHFWRTVGSDEVQSMVLSHHINEQEKENILIVYKDDTYGAPFEDALSDYLKSMNPDVNIDNFPYSDMDSNFNFSNNLRNKDAVVFIAPEVSDVLTFTEMFFAEDENICPITEDSEQDEDCTLPSLYLADGSANEDFLTFINESNYTDAQISRISGSRPGLIRDSTAYENFVTDYDAFRGNFFGTFDQTVSYANAQAMKQTYAPYAYDAVWMIVYAYDWAFTHTNTITNASDVSRGIRRLSNIEATTDYNVTPSNWVPIRGIFSSSADASVNITGASGNLDYDLESEELQNPIDIWNIKQSKLNTLYECSYCLEGEEGCSEQLIRCMEQ
jgi:hypothetical protein